MNKNLEPAHAGTLESSDVFVRIIPSLEGGISIELESSVGEIYEEDILALAKETLSAMKVDNVRLMIQDKGALDYVIKARIQTAILRASGKMEPEWEALG